MLRSVWLVTYRRFPKCFTRLALTRNLLQICYSGRYRTQCAGVRAGAEFNADEAEPAKTKSRKISKENAALCGALQLSSGAEDKGFEPSTGYPAPDFESGS